MGEARRRRLAAQRAIARAPCRFSSSDRCRTFDPAACFGACWTIAVWTDAVARRARFLQPIPSDYVVDYPPPSPSRAPRTLDTNRLALLLAVTAAVSAGTGEPLPEPFNERDHDAEAKRRRR